MSTDKRVEIALLRRDHAVSQLDAVAVWIEHAMNGAPPKEVAAGIRKTIEKVNRPFPWETEIGV